MNVSRLSVVLAAVFCGGSAAGTPAIAEPLALNAYNAPISESSVSGISSGAFMAVQFGTAWSSVIKGVGAIAGGPFWCAEADAEDFVTAYWGPILRATGLCMKGPASDLNIRDFIAKANDKASSGDIDPLSNLEGQKILRSARTWRAFVNWGGPRKRKKLGQKSRRPISRQSLNGRGDSDKLSQLS